MENVRKSISMFYGVLMYYKIRLFGYNIRLGYHKSILIFARTKTLRTFSPSVALFLLRLHTTYYIIHMFITTQRLKHGRSQGLLLRAGAFAPLGTLKIRFCVALNCLKTSENRSFEV